MDRNDSVPRSVYRALALFLALTFALTAVFQAISIAFGVRGILPVTGAMWSPGVAALLTCVILGRPIRSLPWGWGSFRWQVWGWALPLGYCTCAYVLIWVLGLGGVPNVETITGWSKDFGMEGSSQNAVLAAGLLLIGVLGIVDKLSRALGEEIGWRGFLVFELRKVMPFWAVGLVSGAIWAVWHYPWILAADYNAGSGSRYLQAAFFTVGVVAAGVIYAYLAFRSRSLWPPAIMHASHNLYVQRIFTPLTELDENTHWWIDEFGIAVPAALTLIAAFLLVRARRESL